MEIGGKTVTIGGMCKGSGMIHPQHVHHAFLSDHGCGILPRRCCRRPLSDVVKDTYNMISVDGDTSTNDTVLLLANGLAGNPVINKKDGDYERFLEALREVNTVLAKKIAGDGEGATALFEVKIQGSSDQRTGCDAFQVGDHLQPDESGHLRA